MLIWRKDHFYGLCDLDSAINIIPYEIYEEIKNDIGFVEMELVDMSVMLADISQKNLMELLAVSTYVANTTFSYNVLKI